MNRPQTTEPIGRAPDSTAPVADPAATLATATMATAAQPAIVIPECLDDVCVTCSDEGRPGVVEQAPAAPFELALVRTDSGLEEVDMTLVGDVRPGDRVLIHAGLALTILDGVA